VLNSWGVMIYPDSRHYEGKYKNNKCHELGVMPYQDGYHYKGDFKDDKCYGQGDMPYLDDGRCLGGRV